MATKAERQPTQPTQWLQEVIDRKDDMTEAVTPYPSSEAFEAFEQAARDHGRTLRRACAACEDREPGDDVEGLAYRWLLVLAWTYQIMVECDDNDEPDVGAYDYDDDESAVAAAQDAYDHLIELARDWLAATWWVERRLDDDEEAEGVRRAVQAITRDVPEPEEAAAVVRRAVVERYRQAGDPIPRWLLGTAAREFLNEIEADK